MPVDSPVPPNSNDDMRIITAFRAGDPAAFERVYLNSFDGLCQYAAVLIGVDSAGDVVHDVLCAIWNARASLSVNTEKELQYYLVRAVRNRAITVQRRERTREEKLSLWRDESNGDADDSQIHNFDNIDDTDDYGPDVDMHALLPRVRELINSLPPRSREVLTLRWHHGYNFEQIAGIMGVSYGYVRVLHTRAITRVRKHFGLS